MSDYSLTPTVARLAERLLWCALLVAPLGPTAGAQEWAARFPPHQDCQLRLQIQADPQSHGYAGPATLLLHPVSFGTSEPLRGAAIGLSQLGKPNPTLPRWPSDTATVFVFDSLAPGPHVLIVRAVGYYGRTDTLVVTAGTVAVLRVPVPLFHDGYRNRFNCRPRGFRRPGERACVIEGDDVEAQLIHARSLARPDQRILFGLPAGDSTDVALVGDELQCERAGRTYAEGDDPPRRVILIRIGQLYLVYDPFEPLEAGEWNITKIFDRDWRLLVALAG